VTEKQSCVPARYRDLLLVKCSATPS